MPFGDFVNLIPTVGFLLVHIVLFAAGAYFAWRSFGAGASTLGWAFSLFALAEISYMTYHLNWTVILFAHTVSEVLNLLAFTLVFVAASRTILSRSSGTAQGLMKVRGLALTAAGRCAVGTLAGCAQADRRRPRRWRRLPSTCRRRTGSPRPISRSAPERP